MSKTLSTIKGKIGYYKTQEPKTIKAYIRESKRYQRDDVIRIQERIAVYEEISELLNKES